MIKQKTIAREASLEGVGLHTANKVKVVFKPAEADTGINFIRVDLPGKPAIKVSAENIFIPSRSPRRTLIGKEGVEVQTIEHLMAVLSGLGITNINIEVNNVELPGMDGSGIKFLEALDEAGVKEQEKQAQYYSIKEPIFAEEDGASIIALPCPEFKISYTLEYRHPVLHSGFLEVKVDADIIRKEIAAARTFCLESEADELRRKGFGMGANYDNTLVVGKEGVIKNTLRYPDEFVRHKILDLIGDLYLLGCPVKGHIIALRSGHSLNLQIVKKINEQRQKSLIAGISAGHLSQKEEVRELDTATIMKILPHREPFLFVDKVIFLEPGKNATGIKNVTINDYFFKGHFPGKPVMPGVLILEAMAQVGGVMMLAPEENRGKLAFFMAADNVKFRKPVLPGDQLVLRVEAGKIKSRTAQVFGKALVDGKVVAEADFMCALVES